MKKKIMLFVFIMVLSILGASNAYALDKYDGEYTIEYLIRNYNLVTFGVEDKYQYYVYDDYNSTKGNVSNVFEIGGPVLIRGDYIGNTELNWDNEYAQKTNGIPSFIKGKIGDKIKAGSIESAETSKIYVGSSNEVTKDGNFYKVNNDTYKYDYDVQVNDEYLDFDKLYASIVNQQQQLLENSTFLTVLKENVYSQNVVTITSPGNYTLSTANTDLVIKNFDRNKLYIFNILDYNLEFFISLKIESDNSSYSSTANGVYCGRENDSSICTGNIIWNFPNARYIYFNSTNSTFGNIIAPNADIEAYPSRFTGTIIANSLKSRRDGYFALQFYPYNLPDEIIDFDETSEGAKVCDCLDKEEDISNDLYQGNYSIDELLKKYNVVALGQNEYSENSKLKNLTNTKGTVSVFHIVGGFLINGDLGVDNINNDPNIPNITRLNFMSIDSNYSSFVKSLVKASGNPHMCSKGIGHTCYPTFFAGTQNTFSHPYKEINTNFSTATIYHKISNLATSQNIVAHDNYIDFKVLYDAIVEQQEKIEAGTTVRPDSNGVIHIPIGGNYTIENISDASRIVFDNYLENKDKLTIITINDSGDINMPFEGSDVFSNTITNDYINGPGYPRKVEEVYYGNIVFNIPNARYIKFASDNSFKGHIIAPNADLEMPEMNIAGAMIVNSLYAEKNSEIHLYPLSVGSVGKGIEKKVKRFGIINKITISGKKIWDDKDNQDGKRPERITVNLLADGKKIDSKVVTESDDWKYEFEVEETDIHCKKIKYTVTEDAVDNYSTTIDEYDITNYYTPEKTSLTVNKVWKDENDFDKIRPESVEVELYANDEKIDSQQLTSKDNWTYIFNELDMYSNGEKIEYTIKEKSIDGYTSEVSGNQEKGYTITNTHKVEHKEETIDNEKPKENNPITLDSIIKYIIIFGVSIISLVVGITLYIRKRREA